MKFFFKGHSLEIFGEKFIIMRKEDQGCQWMSKFPLPPKMFDNVYSLYYLSMYSVEDFNCPILFLILLIGFQLSFDLINWFPTEF